MSNLTALAIVPLPRTTVADPAIQRRAKFLKQLELQRELAKEQGIEPTKSKCMVQADGTKQLVTVPNRRAPPRHHKDIEDLLRLRGITELTSGYDPRLSPELISLLSTDPNVDQFY